jgi:dephospho-CoA kinase
MLIAGLTGGFGTGKTYVASIFRKLGAKVIDADKLAHAALKEGSPTYKKIVAAFDRSVLVPTGAINRKALGKIVFDDKKRLAQLNGIIHPFVMGKIKERIKAGGSGMLIIDAPLICETALSGMIDVLIVVKASRKNQLERCMKKFKMEEEDVDKRMACQIPLKEKVEKADYIVDNNGTRKGTEKEVKQIWQELKRKKGAILWR